MVCVLDLSDNNFICMELFKKKSYKVPQRAEITVGQECVHTKRQCIKNEG